MKTPSKTTLQIECGCAGRCAILVFDRWDDETDFYADIYQVPQKATFRYRARNAWRSLLGQSTYEPGMVIDGHSAMRLASWLAVEVPDASRDSDLTKEADQC